MIRIREAIIVEGRYDKNTLAQVVDAPILETSGFGIFHDSQRLALLRRLAETRGIIVLTDSDGAGFVIRNYLRGAIDPTQVKHAYIPDVAERGAAQAYRLERGQARRGGHAAGGAARGAAPRGRDHRGRGRAAAGRAHHEGRPLRRRTHRRGGQPAARQRLLEQLDLPEHLSTNALLEVLNALMTREAFRNLCK